MSHLNVIWPISGGLLIGLSAALYLLLNGRIAGISGMTASTFGLTGEKVSLPAVGFLAGIFCGAASAFVLVRQADVTISSQPMLLVAGGLMVGFGTRLGSECTSGHGVCGLARGARRSIAATLTFMTVAAVTVYVGRHLVGGL
ncbi:YeeE/YedE family protein [Rhizobium cauense]|uniref:YeeE/YedE family protein n=1 Tax=Rhizobium cauense TaxID=1166683 RepID=UPI001C6E16EE|nr:YeeE/YedE thiosulfate transporter family protein [Rhizobium cauense]MBW9114741.1 YeeE/YedE family protein [Rhizobium cauense]